MRTYYILYLILFLSACNGGGDLGGPSGSSPQGDDASGNSDTPHHLSYSWSDKIGFSKILLTSNSLRDARGGGQFWNCNSASILPSNQIRFDPVDDLNFVGEGSYWNWAGNEIEFLSNFMWNVNSINSFSISDLNWSNISAQQYYRDIPTLPTHVHYYRSIAADVIPEGENSGRRLTCQILCDGHLGFCRIPRNAIDAWRIQ